MNTIGHFRHDDEDSEYKTHYRESVKWVSGISTPTGPAVSSPNPSSRVSQAADAAGRASNSSWLVKNR